MSESGTLPFLLTHTASTVSSVKTLLIIILLLVLLTVVWLSSGCHDSVG